jgi:hypothetical protein
LSPKLGQAAAHVTRSRAVAGAIHPARDERLACAQNIPQKPAKAGVDVHAVPQTLGATADLLWRPVDNRRADCVGNVLSGADPPALS